MSGISVASNSDRPLEFNDNATLTLFDHDYLRRAKVVSGNRVYDAFETIYNFYDKVSVPTPGRQSCGLQRRPKGQTGAKGGPFRSDTPPQG